MELVDSFFRARLVFLLELHCIPAVFSPILPILHQHIDRDFSFPNLGSCIENLLLAVITLSALPISVGPLRKQGRFTGKLPIFRNDLVQLRAIEKVVINGLTQFGPEGCRIKRRPHSQLNPAGAASRRHFVFLIPFQANSAARRTWCQNVVKVDDVLFTDVKHKLILVIAAQHKTIRSWYAGDEPSLAGTWVDRDRLIGGIEVRQGCVIPENAVALTRHEKRNRNICIRLMQSNWNAAEIKDSFLVLAKTIQRFVCRRTKSLLNVPSLRFEYGGYIKRFPTLLGFGQHWRAIFGQESQRSGRSIDGHVHNIGRDFDLIGLGCDLSLLSFTRLAHDRNLGRRNFRCRTDDNMDHTIAADLNSHAPGRSAESHAVGVWMRLRNREMRTIRSPSC